LKQYPSDSVTSNGLQFWAGTKRCPQALHFDAVNNIHTDFARSFAILYGQMYGVDMTVPMDNVFIANTLETHKDKLTPYKVIETFAATEKEEKENKEKEMTVSSADDTEKFISELSNIEIKALYMMPHDFEKDDDSNHHIDFVTAVSNLRAVNYHIPVADRHKTKGIAGRIIPAIATTTSLVAGLVSLELCKLVAGHNELEKFRNAFINLGLSIYAFSEPVPATKIKIGNKEFTQWDHIDIKGDMKMSDFRSAIYDIIGAEVDTVLYRESMLYCGYSTKYNVTDRDNQMMTNIFSERDIEFKMNEFVPIEVGFDFDDMEDMEDVDDTYIPTVRYWPSEHSNVQLNKYKYKYKYKYKK